MHTLSGTVLRRAVDDVEAEIAAADKAQRKAKREARVELLRSRREQDRHAVRRRVAELQRKLSRGEKAPSG